MAADKHLYHLDPGIEGVDIVKYAVEVKTAVERKQWLDDAETLPFEERKFRASVVSAVNRFGPAPEFTAAQLQAQRQKRAKRFKGFSYEEPRGLSDFLSRGGMQHIELNVGRIAAKRAIRFEQTIWLPTLQAWAKDKDLDGLDAMLLRKQIKRLRRILGRKQSKTERRAQTRERVRRHRATTAAE